MLIQDRGIRPEPTKFKHSYFQKTIFYNIFIIAKSLVHLLAYLKPKILEKT